MAQLRVALAALVALGGLAACDGDPEPEIADPTSSPTAPSASPVSETTSPTASSGPEEPPLPATATENSDLGARAFAAYWIQLVNYAQSTGDVKALKSASDRRCDGCTGLVEAIEEPYLNGGHIEGGEFRVGEFRELPPDFGADWGGFATGRVDPQTVVNASGDVERSSGSKIHVYAYLSWSSDHWVMRWLRTPVPA